jgi:parallel beta-helix repeat protein
MEVVMRTTQRARWLAPLLILALCGCGLAPDQASPPVSLTGTPRAAAPPERPGVCAAPDAAASAQASAGGALDVRYNGDTNTIVLRGAEDATIPSLSAALGRPDLMSEQEPGVWLLRANLEVLPGASLRVAAPEVRWLRLRSDEGGFVALKALGGRLTVDRACVSSWDEGRGGYDENYADGRSFVLARDGARLDIVGSELHALGYDANEAYGLSWRQQGTTGSLVNSVLDSNYFGMYSYEASDLALLGNEVRNSALYGLDPHTRSQRLAIIGNHVHHNGKHGIILADECTGAQIRGNVVHNNLHHGIVLYDSSNHNEVAGNTVFDNGAEGININGSAANHVRDNAVYGNRLDT